MRSPSPRILKDRVDIYVAATQQDTDGGPMFVQTGPPNYPQQPCTVQAHDVMEIVDAQERVTQYRGYRVMFGAYIPITPRDVLVYQDPIGVSHTLFVETSKDNAGRGAAFTVPCIEKL